MIASVADHLWQSTLLAVAAALLTIAFRHNRASVRYGIWFVASLKFLVPFALFMAVGGQLELGQVTHRVASPELSSTVVQVSQPFALWWPAVPASASHSGTLWTELTMLSLWLGGVVAVAAVRIRLWRRIRKLAHSGTPSRLLGVALPAQLEVRSVPSVIEPSVVGWRRPVLMMPVGIAEYLTGPQLEAVVMHELCHIRRRDNLTAGVQMVVEALFWFHPMVWWIGARMVHEREKACDEVVLSQGVEPSTYAEAILNVCKRYVAVPLVSVSGVSGADLRRRLESIVARRVGARVGTGGGIALGVSLVTAVACPIVVGALEMPLALGASRGQSAQAAPPSQSPSFEAASLKLNRSGPAPFRIEPIPGRLRGTNVPARFLIAAAFAEDGVPLHDSRIIGGPSWLQSSRFDLEATAGGLVPPGLLFTMLRSLLMERWKLTTHWEQREAPSYALILDRRNGELGPQLRRSSVDCDALTAQAREGLLPATPRPLYRAGLETITGTCARISMLALSLSQSPLVGRPVEDRTGLAGWFEIDLEWTVEHLPGQPTQTAGGAPTSVGAELFTALREQLGLRLTSTRAPVDVLVIDSAELRTDN